MNDKKTQTSESVPTLNVKNFVGDIKSEFKKISWTSKDELKVYTKVVVGGTFIFGMMVYAMDLIIQTALKTLNFVLTFITG